MRIAIGYFGIPRCSDVSYPSIVQNILQPLRQIGEVKEFYHLYKLDHIESSRSGENTILPPSVYAPFLSLTGELELPGPALERWDASSILKFGNDFQTDRGDNGRTFANLIHQLASLHRLTEIIDDWAPDVVAFVRPDLLYHDKWDTAPALDCAGHPNRAYIPEWQNWGGMNDRFALAGAKAARVYGNRIEQAIAFCRIRRRPLHSERLVGWVLERGHVSLRTVSWTASRVRANREVRQESFQRDWHPAPTRWLLKLVRKVRDPLRNLTKRQAG